MSTTSPEEVRAILQPAFQFVAEVEARSPHRLQQHIDARRAADALNTAFRTLTGQTLQYPPTR